MPACKAERNHPTLTAIWVIAPTNSGGRDGEILEHPFNFDFRFAVVRIENQSNSRFVPGSIMAQFPAPNGTEHTPGQQCQANSACDVTCPDSHSYCSDNPDCRGSGRALDASSSANQHTGSEKADSSNDLGCDSA